MKENVNAAEDFLSIITTSHILTAVMSYLKMSSLDDMPSTDIVNHNIWMEDDATRKEVLQDISSHVVDTHVDLSTTFKHPDAASKGTAYDYACEALSLGLLIMDFKDAIREGDGERVLSLWKYFLLIFKASGRKNYAMEGLTLLSQYNMLLPPNLAEQVKWSRFVNVHGLPGHNISCDLHMEHVNRIVKVVIEGLGSNKTATAISKAAKAIGVLSEAMESFDSKVQLKAPSGMHSREKIAGDLQRIVKELLTCDVFNPANQTTHKSFSHLRKNLIKTLQEDNLKKWMIERFSILLQPDFSPPTNTESDSNESM